MWLSLFLLRNALISFWSSLFALSASPWPFFWDAALAFALAFAFALGVCMDDFRFAKPLSSISPMAFFPVSLSTCPRALTRVFACAASPPAALHAHQFFENGLEYRLRHTQINVLMQVDSVWPLNMKLRLDQATLVLILAVDFVDSEAVIIRKLSWYVNQFDHSWQHAQHIDRHNAIWNSAEDPGHVQLQPGLIGRLADVSSISEALFGSWVANLLWFSRCRPLDGATCKLKTQRGEMNNLRTKKVSRCQQDSFQLQCLPIFARFRKAGAPHRSHACWILPAWNASSVQSN